ncbi:hypothetical protein OSH11_16300 [Kaistia dalseonensis]|uniref:Uncharacterized protein n=1 Tax=Kaistia dalseonensis TaxID=410840 RepID=A0ABU0H989_9HYPH|nr:hypothetical protein [Kaistia dalseonensis]MCX5496271.1 hypothetical protein [Kaistia dalseonensis]MDQ0438889.1 hypothetical protein [Kaistia dalseonensis]
MTVSEIDCRDMKCPGKETIVLVMEQGRKGWILRLLVPIDQVTQELVDRRARDPAAQVR